MIYGKRVRLRAKERTDIPTFVRWLNDPEVREGISAFLPISSAQEEKWFENQLTLPLEEQTLFLQVARGERSAFRLNFVSTPIGPLPPRLHNLPVQSTSFVGRQNEIGELKARLDDPHTRLLTITGPGGIGKTRLALQVASQLVDMYHGGVWFVELASLSDPALVPATILSTLGLSEQPRRPPLTVLTEFFQGKFTLVLLDNCEHLIQVCAELAETLMRACPGLHILATSREALSIPGEILYLVPPLTTPDPAETAVDTLPEYEAVQLFIERAQTTLPEFSNTQDNAQSIVKVCHQLDGIPLALELAAARLKVLRVEEIATRLDHCFGLLKGGARTALPRHKTLQAMIDWSYGLLSDHEKILFCRLAVFVGGWTLEAAESVCGEEREDFEVLDLLAHLVDKSLVTANESKIVTRYHMLETTRQYAQEKLFASKESVSLRNRHRDYFLALTERAEPHLIGGPTLLDWLNLLEAEHDNIRAALAWLQTNQKFELSARLAYALAGFWETKGYLQEGRKWLESGLAQQELLSKAVLAKTLYITRRFALKLGDIPTAEAYGKESVVLLRELDDKRHLAWALRGLGELYVEQNEKERGDLLLKEAMTLFQEVGDKWGILYMQMDSAFNTAMYDEYSRAVTVIKEYQSSAHELDDVASIGGGKMALGIAEFFQGNVDVADKLFREGLTIIHPFGDLVLATRFLEGLAAIAEKRGQFIRAAKLWGAAQHLYKITGYISDKLWVQRIQEPIVRSVRAQLGEAGFEAACTEGRAMTAKQAITYALEKQEY